MRYGGAIWWSNLQLMQVTFLVAKYATNASGAVWLPNLVTRWPLSCRTSRGCWTTLCDMHPHILRTHLKILILWWFQFENCLCGPILVVGYHRPIWTFTVSICWGWWHQKVFKTICFSRNWCCFLFDFKEIVGHISEEACHISHLGMSLDDISQNGSSATWRQQERTRLKPNLCKVAPIHTIAHHFFFWEIIWFYFLKMFIFLPCKLWTKKHFMCVFTSILTNLQHILEGK